MTLDELVNTTESNDDRDFRTRILAESNARTQSLLLKFSSALTIVNWILGNDLSENLKVEKNGIIFDETEYVVYTIFVDNLKDIPKDVLNAISLQNESGTKLLNTIASEYGMKNFEFVNLNGTLGSTKYIRFYRKI